MARDKRIDYFNKNLKKAIKDNGYKVVDFPVEYLGCTYQTFNWRLQNGHFLTKDLHICMDMLGVSLDDLLKKVEVKKRNKNLKKENASFEMLKNLLDQ
jgi:hypothetical protein